MYTDHMLPVVDMHIHSTFSDGTCTPEEIVSESARIGLKSIILTDHDTFFGYPYFYEACKDAGIETMPGIEISTSWNGKSVHILGYGFNPEDESFIQTMFHWQDLRQKRNEIMIERMQKDGIPISTEILKEANPDAVVTRANMGAFLVEKGYVPDINTAFRTLLGKHSKYYEPVKRITPMEAVEFLKSHGAAAVFAHPILTGMCEMQLDSFTGMLREAGLDGIEGYYSGYSDQDRKCVARIARKYDLFLTGGSDFHGANKPDISLGTGKGQLLVPPECYENVKKCLGLL